MIFECVYVYVATKIVSLVLAYALVGLDAEAMIMLSSHALRTFCRGAAAGRL